MEGWLLPMSSVEGPRYGDVETGCLNQSVGGKIRAPHEQSSYQSRSWLDVAIIPSRRDHHTFRTMSTPLLQQFPSLASYPPSFLKDLLSSPELTEAFLFTLPEVQELAADVERLGKENDQMASELARLVRLEPSAYQQRGTWIYGTSCSR